jgi:RNA polymerase sigma-70 factor (ECF subfamily)
VSFPSLLRRRRALCTLARVPGEPEAFAEFYEAYSPRVLVFFARRVFDAELAMELTSETFALALDNCEQFRGTLAEEEQGWLFAIARHELSRFWRRGRVEREALVRIGVSVPAFEDEDLERVERMAGLDGLKDALREAMAGLPEGQRRAVELRVLEEMGYPQIAEALTVSEDVARARVSRGLRSMAAALDGATDNWEELS